MLIEWTDALSVGNEAIDNDHRRLLKIVGDLDAAIAAGKGPQVISETLVVLTEYAREHFEREERVMLRHHYFGYNLHKWAHDGFLDELGRIIGRLEAGEAEVDRDTLALLLEWLDNHVCGLDRQLATFLRR